MILITTDTNIVVSSLKNRAGNEAEILRRMWRGQVRACVSPAILDEYENVLRRPKLKFDMAEVSDVPHFFRTASLAFPDMPDTTESAATSPDPSDTRFIACAITANAAFLVTGNRRHFPAAQYGTAEVVNARELLARLPVF